jgi:hypothetical protein
VWSDVLPLPDGQRITSMTNSSDQLFAIAGGQLYRRVETDWEWVNLPDSANANLTSVQFQYPDKFWVLDAAGQRLWWSADGQNWTLVPVVRAGR